MVPAKLEIVRDYGKEYSRILAKQELLSHAYIDAFTGPGVHVLRTTGEMVVGFSVNALEISPPFADYYFIDTDGDKVGALRRLAGGPPGVHIFQGDCHELLPENVYPHVRYENYRGRLFSSKTRSKQRKVIEGGSSEPPGPGKNAAGLALFRYRTRCGTVWGDTGNTQGYTQFAAASPDGRRSVTVSVNAQHTPTAGRQAVFEALRRAKGLAVCAALADL
jgi:hypothetical protein